MDQDFAFRGLQIAQQVRQLRGTPQHSATGQFGKNHQGDRDEHLPTMHGFDEFVGNLYHLNAEEEPENEVYPRDPEFAQRFGPRGVMHSWATEDGGQKMEDTGPLTKKRMETCDTEFVAAAQDFVKRAHENDQPFFVWLNTTWMHFRVHPPEEILGQAQLPIFHVAHLLPNEKGGAHKGQRDDKLHADQQVADRRLARDHRNGHPDWKPGIVGWSGRCTGRVRGSNRSRDR